jgi:DNA-directed RNA polymerase omega subunit
LGIKNRDQIASRFEFVVTAGARARQLLKGATPRVVGGGEKAITIAQQEVSTGEVRKVEPEPAKE